MSAHSSVAKVKQGTPNRRLATKGGEKCRLDGQVYPYGATQTTGLLKSRPEDFKVVEELGFEPDGQGEHLLLSVEKNGITTPELLDRVARQFAIHPRQIGYSGLKDKHALARQWLSLHLPGWKQPVEPLPGEGYRILEYGWHGRKLRTGTHKTNRFTVVLREVTQFPDASESQLQRVRVSGFANYFGAQRFGRKQDNVAQALKRLSSRLSHRQRGLYLSALRSYLFNRILSQRLALGYWEQPLEGDVFMLRGSHSIFSDSLDQNLLQRFQSMDISNTASLYGRGHTLLSGAPLEIESQVIADYEDIADCLDQHQAKRQMRALRTPVEDLDYDYDAARHTLELKVRLPAGSYLTSLLDHFIETR